MLLNSAYQVEQIVCARLSLSEVLYERMVKVGLRTVAPISQKLFSQNGKRFRDNEILPDYL